VTTDLASAQLLPIGTQTNPSRGDWIKPFALLGSFSRLSSSNEMMPPRTEATITKATEPYLEVGLICADRDGNRIRIDRVDRDAGTLSYHFLNDELRVQEGVQERSIDQFLAEGWYMATSGKSL